jgi:hypothetical protein
MSSSQAFLMSGAGEVDAPVFEQESSANIRFADTDCYWLVICNPVEPYREGFALSAISRDVAVSTMYQPGYVGQVHESNLEVSSWNYGATDFAAFDWTTAAPMDIVTRALNETSGVYYDTLYTCTGESFCQSEIVGAFRFDVTSVTRGSDTHDVPEPGTIGLFAFGLAGLWLVRRRVLPAGGAAARGA